MAFKDLREFSEGRHIDLPIDGVTYRISDVDAETGLLVQRLMDAGLKAHESGRDVDLDEELLDDAREARLYEDILGDALEEMRDNRVPWSDIKRAAMTTMIWIAFDEETAEKYWESESGEAAAPAAGPNRATRRASSASARKTRSRASTKPTKASTSATRKKAPASRGGTSGSSGT